MCTFDECRQPLRRSFLTRGAALALAALVGVRARASGSAIESRELEFPTSVGAVRGHVALPADRSRHPGIVLMHGEFQLPQTHRDTADELARAGFAALAVQRFSRVPGMTWNDLQADDHGEGHYRSATFAAEELAESAGALDWLSRSERVDPMRLGAIGFCGGGIRAIQLAAGDARVRCVVAFYPPPRIPQQYKNSRDPAPDLLELAKLPTCPLQIHFGSDDYIVKKADMDLLVAKARESGARVDAYEYAGSGHAFYDRTDSSAYRANAAVAAKKRYLQFLRHSLA
jgi:carboxymethylenebutenolidase